MNIVVLEGSPNKNGSSNMLASAFMQGAREAGHAVYDKRFEIYAAGF